MTMGFGTNDRSQGAPTGGWVDHRSGPYFIRIFRAMARSSSSRSCSRKSCEGWSSPPLHLRALPI